MQANLVASSLAVLSLLFPPISIVSSASVSLITLRRGAYEGFSVLLIACISSALLGLLLFGNFQFALIYGAVLWLPVWLISIILREGKQLSLAVEVTVLIGVVGVIGFYLYVDNPSVLWQSILNQLVQPVVDSGNTDVPIEQINASVQSFSQYMTGGIVAGSVYGLLFGLLLARWWQSILYNPGGFKEEYLSIKAHLNVVVGSAIVLVIGWFTSNIISEVCWNILIVLAVLYTFVGASVLHCAFLSTKARRFMVPFLYMTMILIPHMIALVIIVGFLDTWLDLRKRISNKSGTT